VTTYAVLSMHVNWGTAASAPPLFGLGKYAICGSHHLVTP